MLAIGSGSHFAPRTGSRRSWWQNGLLLLHEHLLLDLLLLGDLGRGGNLGRLAVEGDLGLLEVTAGICWETSITR